MSNTEIMTARLDDLEIRLMHQDQIIEDLNITITDQWRQIEALTRQFATLSQNLAESSNEVAPNIDTPPPHY